ncbi:MAG: hypothetical protein CME70_12500 [Halobacteriovorax sp.]|nr:hypothetical protein [Halobacteriovorax sp.]|tara:strand:- start:233634 stop:234599 length:966 start_codon:yes stop_codon:yes gene_type:complete
MNLKIFSSFLILLLFPLNLLAKGEQKIWSINKDHSELTFKVGYLSISSITGRFEKFWGQIRFDEDGVLPNKVNFHLEVKSVSSGSEMRDGHLKSSDFFNAKKYPYIKFKSEKIEALEPGWFKVVGELEIKDITREEEFKIFISEIIDDTWGYKSKFIKFAGSIDRKDYQLDWNKGIKGNELLVGMEVDLLGQFQIQPVNRKTPPSKHMIPNTKFSKLRDKFKTGKISKEEFDNSVLKIETEIEKKVAETKSATEEVVSGANEYEALVKQAALLIMRLIGFVALWMGILGLRKKIKNDTIFGTVISLYTVIYLWAFWFVQFE